MSLISLAIRMPPTDSLIGHLGTAPLNIHIADWNAWAARDGIPTEPGVYLIAKGKPGDIIIIYIGKTWGGDGLRGRLLDFHRSATTGLKGHAGGVTYHAKFGNAVDDLHVAMHVPVAIRREPEILYAYVLYVERRLIWEFVERVGRLPACNSE